MKRDEDLILKNEVFEVVSCCFEVLREIGHGFREKAYERALVCEFELREIEFEQQKSFPMHYKGVQVDEFIPDLIVFGALVVDTKVIERITENEIGQMLNYLKITNLPVGLIVNFKRPKLEWKRVVLQARPRRVGPHI
ncbi:MAG: GxxExxY protein [Verrucomicrobiae bacterium]|nr:GxxExxY protein [Verrucomicrobiae bacterium]